jgi:hypothetical protein
MSSSNSETATNSLSIGGTHGHVEESIGGDLLNLWRAPFCEWKPIRNCTGRYTCREKKPAAASELNNNSNRSQHCLPSALDPLELIHSALQETEENPTQESDTLRRPYWNIEKFDPPSGRTDCVWVLPLDAEKTVGIISYVKEETIDGNEHEDTPTPTKRRFVHTLNSPSGFQRKLEAVNITLKSEERKFWS